MPVPNDEIVCHFIEESDWSEVLKAPKAKSLKQKDMSVWHPGRLAAQGATLDDLRFREFTGAGKLMLTPDDYFAIAEKVASKTGTPFELQAEWRPEDEFVGPDWRAWRNAHAQVEMLDQSIKHFPQEFRALVGIIGMRKPSSVPPDRYLQKPSTTTPPP